MCLTSLVLVAKVNFFSFSQNISSCLIVGSAYHKNTDAKVERANGVISDTLRAYANGRKDDWDSHLTLAEFAINTTASMLGDDLTPFFVGRGAHPRRPLSPPHHDLAVGDSTASRRGLRACARWRRRCGSCSRRRRPTGRRSSMRAASTRCSRSATGCCCGPRSCSTPPTLVSCALALPRRMRCSPTVNVDRLKPFFKRVGAPPAPGPVSDRGQEGEHEVELLLNHRVVCGVTRYLVRWRGRTSADDEWLREESWFAPATRWLSMISPPPSSCGSPGRAAVPPPRRRHLLPPR